MDPQTESILVPEEVAEGVVLLSEDKGAAALPRLATQYAHVVIA